MTDELVGFTRRRSIEISMSSEAVEEVQKHIYRMEESLRKGLVGEILTLVNKSQVVKILGE